MKNNWKLQKGGILSKPSKLIMKIYIYIYIYELEGDFNIRVSEIMLNIKTILIKSENNNCQEIKTLFQWFYEQRLVKSNIEEYSF